MTLDDNAAKALVVQLLDTIEALVHEKIALTSILQGVNAPGFQEQWQRSLADLLGNKTANEDLSRKFLGLRERAQRTLTETIALELLQLIPEAKSKAH